MTLDERLVGAVVERKGERPAPFDAGCDPTASALHELAALAGARVPE
jgi:hypothetical protein